MYVKTIYRGRPRELGVPFYLAGLMSLCRADVPDLPTLPCPGARRPARGRYGQVGDGQLARGADSQVREAARRERPPGEPRGSGGKARGMNQGRPYLADNYPRY